MASSFISYALNYSSSNEKLTTTSGEFKKAPRPGSPSPPLPLYPQSQISSKIYQFVHDLATSLLLVARSMSMQRGVDLWRTVARKVASSRLTSGGGSGSCACDCCHTARGGSGIHVCCTDCQATHALQSRNTGYASFAADSRITEHTKAFDTILDLSVFCRDNKLPDTRLLLLWLQSGLQSILLLVQATESSSSERWPRSDPPQVAAIHAPTMASSEQQECGA